MATLIKLPGFKLSLTRSSRPTSTSQHVIRATKRTQRLALDVSANAASVEQQTSVPLPTAALEQVAKDLSAADSSTARSAVLLQYAKALPRMADDAKTNSNRVMGCTAQVWVTAQRNADGTIAFSADSDAELTRGLCAILVNGLSGLGADEIAAVDPASLMELGLGGDVLTRSRTNGFLNMLEAMKKRARALQGELPQFPTLVITAEGTSASGAFAQAQEQYLKPDSATVDKLVDVLSTKKIGIVAHFYMDPEVQGVLSSAAERWPHVKISDSLVMADGAVKMAEEGCKAIAVLGVDFMSENVRAILDEAGHTDVKVYRMAADAIGCSLADAAESEPYIKYLDQASTTPKSLHVVYINTSLKTKALAHEQVPTITCTSSNVVQTVLQAFAQVPDATVWYGPDTYMGRNLAQLLTSLATTATEEEVKALHPSHTPATIRAALPRLKYFDQGMCVVHHLFGGEVCDLVRSSYSDAYLTAHFEVPGEMFTLAMEAKTRGMGVVGSTQNILDFISARLDEAIERPFADRLQFVLGTETGMVTSIVRKVQSMLSASGRKDITVEIVFPVSLDSITTDKQESAVEMPGGLSVIPGPASGEGCSLEGGCASCPYMKMNSLQALMTVCDRIDTAGEATIELYKPKAYEETVGAAKKSMAQAGCVPILHMRDFQRSKKFSDALVNDMTSRVSV